RQPPTAPLHDALPISQLRAPGDRADIGRLSLLTHLQGGADAGGEAVVPRGLDQYAANVTVAGLGDRAEPSLGTGRVLGGHQPQRSEEHTSELQSPDHL